MRLPVSRFAPGRIHRAALYKAPILSAVSLAPGDSHPVPQTVKDGRLSSSTLNQCVCSVKWVAAPVVSQQLASSHEESHGVWKISSAQRKNPTPVRQLIICTDKRVGTMAPRWAQFGVTTDTAQARLQPWHALLHQPAENEGLPPGARHLLILPTARVPEGAGKWHPRAPSRGITGRWAT